MGFKVGQKIIDKIRGKKHELVIPESQKSASFESKIKALLKVCAVYHYPETKNDYVPDFTKPVQVETVELLNEYAYKRALAELETLDMGLLEETYRNLSDEYSKEIMLQVIAYNCFDEPKLRFPIFYSPDLELSDYISTLAVDDEKIDIWNSNLSLSKLNLSKLGFNITLWQNPLGTIIDFVQEQYKYKHVVEAQEGDVALDAGACYGDTALYFSEKTKGAKVYSFEFIPENLEMFRKNIELNPQYKDNIELVQRPIGSVSGNKLYAVPNGPGTNLTDKKTDNAIELETITIDDFVAQNNIEKIDFIKMDIEGSEEDALKGAKKTISKFKPKLAICAYHKKDDLCILPQLIKSIVPEYKLYLNHYTINATETVLFAKV
ncbi:MAG: FkbM family methyltransferase [Candidatus Gastranaerophilales bacterium]|nr:FkbM family methyltransferase [Candidatus Gastranaerophilales bacterium]